MPNVTASDLEGLIVFRLGGDLLALPVEVVAEVVPYAWLARPPQMPAAVEGVLDLGGRAITVLRLDRLLRREGGEPGLEASILIMRGAGFGLLVDHVERVRSVSGAIVLPVVPERSFNGCLAGEVMIDGSAVHLLHWPRLLLEEERRRLADFQAQADARLAAPGTP